MRALFDNVFLFDTTVAHYVWEHPYYPQYYVPATEFRDGVLFKREQVGGGGVCWAVVKGKQRETGRVLWFVDGVLAGLVRVDFGAVGL